MVQMNDVRMVYGNTEAEALSGVSFTINEGEFVFLVGPSGSGKTTIIKLITGELSPTSGQITVNGFDMQGIKRRIMEMADTMVITKADGENVRKAELARTQFQGALRLFPLPESGWRPKVYTCSAVSGAGLEEVWKGVEEFLDHTQGNGFFRHNRNRQNKYWMYETIDETLKNSFYRDPRIEAEISVLEGQVLDDKISSFIAAKRLLDLYFGGKAE